MATITQEFQSAPMGRKVTLGIVLALAAGFVGIVFSFVVSYQHPGRLPWIPATHTITSSLRPEIALKAPAWQREFVRLMPYLAPLFGLLIAIPMVAYERSKVSRFQIEDNSLVLGKKRFSLAGLVDVARDPEVMRGARRTWGGKSVGSIRGSFKSKRVGKFYAFMTGAENAVVLRWPDKVVSVSPADPEFFILLARKAAGLQ
jgi:hypothetical protein